MVSLVYSLILLGRGDYNGVLKMVGDVEEIIKCIKVNRAVMSIYIAMKGALLVEANMIEAANLFFRENGLSTDKEITYFDEHGYTSFAFLLITELKFDEAEKLLERLMKMAITAKSV